MLRETIHQGLEVVFGRISVKKYGIVLYAHSPIATLDEGSILCTIRKLWMCFLKARL